MLIHFQPVDDITHIIRGYRDDEPDGFARRLRYGMVACMSVRTGRMAVIGPMLARDGAEVDVEAMAAIAREIRAQGLPVDLVEADRHGRGEAQRYGVDRIISRAAGRSSRP